MTQQAYTGTLEALQRHAGPCREWLPNEARICGKPPEYILWGKLIPGDGLGPRCYDHAAAHVGHHALASCSGFALVNLRDLAFDLGTAFGGPIDA